MATTDDELRREVTALMGAVRLGDLDRAELLTLVDLLGEARLRTVLAAR
ncbi:hypothetical protein [Mycobacterium paraintracellulare]|nr:hypothetical protein [Mycobacterium paraintracellulare]